MFTLIRTGKDRKDKDKDWTLCYLYYNIYTVTDYCYQFRLNQHHTIGLLSIFITIQDPIIYYVATQDPIVIVYFSSCGNSISYCQFIFFIMQQLKILFSIYIFHHAATQNPIVNLYFSSCVNSISIVNLYFSLCGNSKSYCQFIFFIMQQLKILLSIYIFHHVATQNPIVNLYFSSCSNSKSWSWHQICDTSFFLFNFKDL